MPSWSDVETEAPQLAATARGLLDAHPFKLLGTVRRDGAPRVCGVETFWAEGELWFGCMGESRKALDLRRDPRFVLHSVPERPPGWAGDAKLAGAVEEVLGERKVALLRAQSTSHDPDAAHLFRADVSELVVARYGGDPPDHLAVESWHAGRGVERLQRR